jgi:hypothetical protein
LQEVDAGRVWDQLLAALAPHGYDGVYKKRGGDKLDGCATLWKRSKWARVAYQPVEFQGLGGIPCMDRDNVAQVCVCLSTESPHRSSAPRPAPWWPLGGLSRTLHGGMPGRAHTHTHTHSPHCPRARLS